MSRIKIAGGRIYDPANDIDGEVRDLWIESGKVVPAPTDPNRRPDRTIDAGGYAVMPGGIDMHCHIAGPKVSAARRLFPDVPTREHGNKNGGGARPRLPLVPAAPMTGRLFAAMGYTTAMDAAIPGLLSRHAHDEFHDTPVLDKGFYQLFGNNHYVLDCVREGRDEQLDAYLAWGLSSCKGYAVKVVNPGGVENYKHISRKTIRELEEPIEQFGVTPRQIVESLSAASDRLNLPHSVHIHCNNLGIPGNWETTRKTMEALGGCRGHIAHIQFHSYAGTPDDPRSFSSATQRLVDYVLEHENVTIDVGHVHPGRTLSMTGDAPFAAHLKRLTGGKWFTADTENEASCGVIPGEFKPHKSLVHAVQWAIAIEWYLLMLDDPWRVALTSDHPNGGAFYRYPEMIHLLMDRDFRREAIERMPADLQQRTMLADIDRAYTLNDIAIITRAAPARILGLKNKGHLGIGADADITIYAPQDDIRAMFERPHWVFKSGNLVAQDGEMVAATPGNTFFTSPEFGMSQLPGIRDWFEQHYSVQLANYPVREEEVCRPLAVG